MKFDFEYQCDKDWDEMKGGDRRRFCDSCDKHVHHISSMTKEDAMKFLDEHDWNVCVDFYRDDDGHTVFREAARKLKMQNDGIKQLLASAAALIPLAIAAAMIDFDKEPTPQPAIAYSAAPTPDAPVAPAAPINLEGPAPVISTPEPIEEPPPTVDNDPTPVFVDTKPPTTEESVEVEPFVAEVDETPDVEVEPPVVKPRPHVRGKIRRPRAEKPMPERDHIIPLQDEFVFLD